MTTTPETTTTPPKATWREWLGLAILTLPIFMMANDMTILFMALPAITADLEMSATETLWTLHIGEFLAVGFILIMGRLAGRVGARRFLMLGMGVYGLASLAAAFAPTPELLITWRAVLGIAAATATPAVMFLLRRMFADPQQFALAIAIFVSAFSAGAALGPPMGGVLLNHFWWGSVFLVNVPVAALLLLSTPMLPTHKEHETGRLDLISVGLSLAALLGVIYGLQEMAEHGLAATYVGSVLIGIILGVIFVRRQLRVSDPLLDLRLFATPAFTVSLIALLVMLLAISGIDMLVPQYLQAVAGLTSTQAGLLLVIPAVTSAVGTMIAPALARKLGAAYAQSLGLVVAALGATVLVALGSSVGVGMLIAVMAIIALGSGPVFTLSAERIISSAPMHQTGTATAMQDLSGGLGGALGIAFVGSLAMAMYRRGLGQSTPEGLSAADEQVAQGSIGGAIAVAEGLPDDVGDQLYQAASDAFVVGIQSAFVVAAMILPAVALMLVWRRHQIDAPADESTGHETAEEAPLERQYSSVGFE